MEELCRRLIIGLLLTGAFGFGQGLAVLGISAPNNITILVGVLLCVISSFTLYVLSRTGILREG